MNQKITFPELVDLMARKQKCTKREAENFLRELMTLMSDTVSEGEELRINSLGTFKPVWVEDRVSVNVQTGEPYTIPGHYKLTFTPIKAVREAVNEPFSCFVVETLPDDAPCVEVSPTPDADECPLEEKVPEVCDEIVAVAVDDSPVEVKESIETAPLTVLNTYANEDEKEAVVIPELNDETLDVAIEEQVDVAVGEDAENFDETVKKAFHKGFWIGVSAAVSVLALLVSGWYVYNRYVVASTDEIRVVHHAHHTDTVDVVLTDNVDTVSLALDEVDTVLHVMQKPEVPASDVRTETVQRGVFLTNIALKYYGHKAFWVYIYEENRHIIDNPDNVPAGTTVVIPPAHKYGIDAADTLAIKRALDMADEIKSRFLR